MAMSRKNRTIIVVLILGVALYLIGTKMGNFNAFQGPTELKDQTFSGNVKVSGPLNFSNINVKGTMSVDGPVTKSSNSEFAKLEISGPAELADVKIQEMDIKGPFHCVDCAIGKLNVSGSATLERVRVSELHVSDALNTNGIEVKDIAQALGSVSVKDSKFKTLKINSEDATLENATIDELVILEPKQAGQKQTVVLSGTTSIKNDIEFKAGEGEVVVKGDKVIMQGIVGGIRKDDKAL